MPEADAVNLLHRPLAPPLPRLMTIDFGQHDVFEHAAVGQQVKCLKDEADALAAQSGPLVLAELCRFYAFKEILPVAWAVEATDDIQQRRFPRAGRAGDRQPFAASQCEVDIDQRIDSEIGPKLSADLAQLDDAVRIGDSRFDWLRRPDQFGHPHLVPPDSAVLYPTTTSWPGASCPSAAATST